MVHSSQSQYAPKACLLSRTRLFSLQPIRAAIALNSSIVGSKAPLLRALIETEVLNASSVLISVVRNLDMVIPSPWSFEHAIAVLQLEEQEIWMDPSPAAPFRMLAYLSAARASVIT